MQDKNTQKFTKIRYPKIYISSKEIEKKKVCIEKAEPNVIRKMSESAIRQYPFALENQHICTITKPRGKWD